MGWLKRKAKGSDVNSFAGASDPPSASRKLFPSGIKLLHVSKDNVVDIVFVHGLTGDREKTWKGKSADSPWPQALLPQEISDARILTFGYDAYVANLRGMVSKNRIGNHSMNLLAALATYREKDDTNKRPIIFVCHSLGGLVCEDALVEAKNRPEEHLRSIFDKTRGIIFLGTPHHGSGLADWAEKLAISIGVLKQTNHEIVAVLKADSEVFARIQGNFHAMIRFRNKRESGAIEITCFYEELPLPGVGVVVPSHSAVLPGYMPIGIRADHRSMTKFEDLEDPGLTAVLGELRRWIRSLRRDELDPINFLTEEQRKKLETRRQKFFESLKFDQIDARHRNIEVAHANTCQWILKRPEYCDWTNDDSLDEHFGFLWIKGKPGAGKSTLMKFVLNHAQYTMKHRTVVSFFFNARGVDLEKSILGIYQSLLYQLLRDMPQLCRVFDSLEVPSTIPDHYQWDVDLLKTLLEQSVRSLGKVKDLQNKSIVCFIDALDECEENQVREMISFFEHLTRVARSENIQF